MKTIERTSQIAAKATQAGRADYLADATRTYLDALEESRVAFAFADSAFSVLQREIERTSDPDARQRALNELTVASGSTAQIVARAANHTNYVMELVDVRSPAAGWQTAAPIRVFFSHSEEDAQLRVHINLAVSPMVSVSEAPEAYWRRVRDELQAYFNVNLRDLQPLVKIAYPTLVNLGRRKPHPNTARMVLQLHTLASHALRLRGNSSGREWLASVGRRTLEQDGIEAFQRLIVGDPIRVAPIGGIYYRDEPEASAAATAQESRTRGERF